MYTEDTILTWGKYKFTSLKNIPARWLLGHHKDPRVKDVQFLSYVADNFGKLEKRAEYERGVVFPVLTIPEPPACDKYQYASEEEAKKHLREIRARGKQSERHKLPVRAYKCHICPFWHLTSKELA